MTPAEQLAAGLRDTAARLRRIPPHCLRDGVALVEWLSDTAREIDRAANLLSPRQPTPRSPVALAAPEGRFETGTIAARGRIVRVETRARRRRAA